MSSVSRLRKKGQEASSRVQGSLGRHPKEKVLEKCVRRIERNLAAAAWEAYRELYGFRENHARAFPLELKVVIEPGHPWCLMTETPVEEQIRSAVRNMVAGAEVFRLGRLYCYRCESAECSHSLPPRPGSVFGGYTPTGLPRWPELSQVLLDLRHPRMDVVYEPSRGDLVAAYVDAEALKCSQLNVFGRQSNTYNIWGQVVFGLVRVNPSDMHAQESQRVAFTVQVVESRRLDGSPRVDLNVVARLWDGSPAIEALRGPSQWRILDLIMNARKRIQNLAPIGVTRRRNAYLRPDAGARATRILVEMSKKLERLGRQVSRRTSHAEERRIDNRPTSKAWEDATASPRENILWDEHRQTVVVLGSRNRVHIFSPEGRHITSLVLEADAVRSRVRRKRWRRLTGDALERFSAAVGRANDVTSKDMNESEGRRMTEGPSS
jgi:hypothetical protein